MKRRDFQGKEHTCDLSLLVTSKWVTSNAKWNKRTLWTLEKQIWKSDNTNETLARNATFKDTSTERQFSFGAPSDTSEAFKLWSNALGWGKRALLQKRQYRRSLVQKRFSEKTNCFRIRRCWNHEKLAIRSFHHRGIELQTIGCTNEIRKLPYRRGICFL